jgi:hypothetical protein
MTTLFLGSYGHGNLGDELCLIDALSKFASDHNIIATYNTSYTKKCIEHLNLNCTFINIRTQLAEFKDQIQKVIIGGGGVGFLPCLKNLLHWSSDVSCDNTIVYNIGVANIEETEWLQDEKIIAASKKIKTVSVREEISKFYWNKLELFRPVDEITNFPETDISPDMQLADSIFTKQDEYFNIGISVTSQQSMINCLQTRFEKIADAINMLNITKPIRLIPIVSTCHLSSKNDDDFYGYDCAEQQFYNFFGDKILKTVDALKDKNFWIENMTPTKLKGCINNLDLIVSQRKHNIIHAIGCNIPFYGIHPKEDDSLPRMYYSLRSKIRSGSLLLAM